jgi:hypothetical protein
MKITFEFGGFHFEWIGERITSIEDEFEEGDGDLELDSQSYEVDPSHLSCQQPDDPDGEADPLIYYLDGTVQSFHRP